MSTRAELLALADRCETAEEGSGELDFEIHVTVHDWKLRDVGPDFDGKNDCAVYTPGGRGIEGFAYPARGALSPYFHVPAMAYTLSIDGALKLLPTGYQWACGFSRYVPHQARVSSSQHAHGGWDGHSDHARALALCAAALRARASLLTEDR